MPEPVSMTLGTMALSGYTLLNALARKDSAISPEAEATSRAAEVVVGFTERSQSLFGAKAAAISELEALMSECSEADWDGGGSEAIDRLAFGNARQFISALPDGLPLPEIAPEPDGSISLDWIRSRNRLYSLSISSSNRLAFAWLDGADTGHGVLSFDGAIIPDRIVRDIQSITNPNHASLRAA